MNKISVELTDQEITAFSDFLRRSTFSDYRQRAQTDDEAYLMMDAARKLREAMQQESLAL